MGTEPLDYQGLLAELDDRADSWPGLPPETALGHMHLHVSYIEEATTFYQDVIGLDLMVAMRGSASFLSAGGYHHHLGLNVWNGVGASPPPVNSIGLRYFTVQVPDKKELDNLIQRLQRALWPTEDHELGLFVKDPSGNGVVFTVMN
jgi:catechol 2,3-dioxygenase